jgi:hypothetical protein
VGSRKKRRRRRLRRQAIQGQNGTMGSVLALASVLLFPVAETAVPKLPSVLVDVAPANDQGAWLLARDERYGDLELWRLTAGGRAERVALPDPDGRRLQAIAASPSGDEVWVLSHRALLRFVMPPSVSESAGGGAAPAAPSPAPEWQATPLWIEGGDLRRGTVVPLGPGRSAWVAELAGADGGPRVIGEIVDGGASVATFSLPCAFRSGASGDAKGGLVIGGIGRIAPSPAGWLGSFASCGEPSGSGIDWQRAPLEVPSRLVAANGASLWHWQGDVLKNGDVDAFTVPQRTRGSHVRPLGTAAGADGRVWLGVHGYVSRSAVTVMSLGQGGVESSFALPLPRWWKSFLRTETVTLREGAGQLWALQTYPGKASILLRRDGTWGKWRAFYGPNVKPRVELLRAPAAEPMPGNLQQTYESSYSCLSPIRSCFAPAGP